MGAVLVALMLRLSWPGLAMAELGHGTATIGGGGFDFSEQQQIYEPLEEGDLYLGLFEGPQGGYRFFTWWNGSLILTADSTLEQITTAPVEDAAYGQEAVPILGQAYIVKTSDGFYAKFAVREYYSAAVIEYYVQLNGTNVFVDPVAIEPTTWGRIKAVYE